MISERDRESLAQNIERVRGQIVDGLFEDMYQNPFWDARYGERGRRHTRQDTHYHLNYLISAIQLNNPNSLVTYYHWVQGLLVYRGMCTRHLQQTIDSLGRQIALLLPESWPIIQPIHHASYDGLIYQHPGCQALTSHQDEIARATAERMVAPGQASEDTEIERQKNACYQDNLYHLSYLADSVAYQLHDGFLHYVEWLQTFLPAQNVPLTSLYADLKVLSDEINQALVPREAAQFTRILANTLAQVG